MPPDAVILSAEPVPLRVRFAATVPKPLSVPFVVVVPKLIPKASVIVPPAIMMVPLVTFWAPLLIVRLPFEIFSVWLSALSMVIGAAGDDPTGKVEL